ncbi:methylated-DNA--[protein]-cysteine S-methyltransferase [Mycetocola spongiae]|uniref:methylated-DNA--[protein]-cysteine S-methyltransferase n=1 Tax=Mycetocola spongiae TaxID=2859226 RepID=UPI0021F417F3|nr:methylated-DNA--[protein]-cysteine S-methyltransferase [Mycetocola spongiae]UCR89838.1 methylated-DNA--[protein]-cysteine S-methyltransferase [Mycetocola spongiae]
MGPLLLIGSAFGVRRLVFDTEDQPAVLAELGYSHGLTPRENPAAHAVLLRELDSYFAGTLRRFTSAIDRRALRGFRGTVLEFLPRLRYGHTASYGSVAEAVGSPLATRAVSNACSHNPVPILIPCHRVIRSSGGLGTYLGGSRAKLALLRLEGAR